MGGLALGYVLGRGVGEVERATMDVAVGAGRLATQHAALANEEGLLLLLRQVTQERDQWIAYGRAMDSYSKRLLAQIAALKGED